MLNIQNEVNDITVSKKEAEEALIEKAIAEEWDIYIDGILTEQKLDTIEFAEYDVKFAEDDKSVSLSRKNPEPESDTDTDSGTEPIFWVSALWMFLYWFNK